MNKYLISTIVHEDNDNVVSSLQPARTANDAFIAHAKFFARQQSPNDVADERIIRETTIDDRTPIVANIEIGKTIYLSGNNDDCNSHIILRCDDV